MQLLCIPSNLFVAFLYVGLFSLFLFIDFFCGVNWGFRDRVQENFPILERKKKKRSLFPQINTPSRVSLKRKITLDLTEILQLSLKTIFFLPQYDFKVNFIIIGHIFIKTLQQQGCLITHRHKLNWLSYLVCVCSVTQSHPTLCDSLDCSPPGSSVHEKVAILFSRKSS